VAVTDAVDAEPTTCRRAPVPLDEVMLAMDVVDTLRHREELVAQELAGGDRDAAMLERLRRIYAAQGIEVPDHVLPTAWRPARGPLRLPAGAAEGSRARGLALRRARPMAAAAGGRAPCSRWRGSRYQQTVVAPRRAWAAA
jgi:hypothetical protein